MNIILVLLIALAFVVIYKKDQQRKQGLEWQDSAIKNINQFLMTSHD